MTSSWKAYQAQVVHLSALFLVLLFSLASLVSCNQPAPVQYVSLNLGIPAAALHSPVKGPLPDRTVLHVGVTFKIDPRLLDQADHQKLQPGQSSNLEALARRLGIDDATYQKIAQFISPHGIVLSLSTLRTHLAPCYSSSGGHPGTRAANEVRHPPVQGPDILRARDAAQSPCLFRQFH